MPEERELSDAIGAVFESFCRYVWPHCGVPGSWAEPSVATQGDVGRYEWREEDRAEFDRAVEWLVDSLIGPGRDAEAFSDPRTAQLQVTNPIYRGTPILLAGLWELFEAGLSEAARIVGDQVVRLVGADRVRAVRALLRDLFGRLCGRRGKLADVLNGSPKVGQSVAELLARAVEDGESPQKIAVRLRDKLREIDEHYWPLVVRMVTGPTWNTALLAEFLARGCRVPLDAAGRPIELPPYHENCRCTLTVLPDSGYIVPLPRPTACIHCVWALGRALTVALSDAAAKRAPFGPAAQSGDRRQSATRAH